MGKTGPKKHDAPFGCEVAPRNKRKVVAWMHDENGNESGKSFLFDTAEDAKLAAGMMMFAFMPLMAIMDFAAEVGGKPPPFGGLSVDAEAKGGAR